MEGLICIIRKETPVRLLWSIVLIILSILFRTLWHIGPNIEFITTATLLASVYLGHRWAIVVSIIAIAVSDMIIGNTSIYLFTWSAYIAIGLMSGLLQAGRLKAYSRVYRWCLLLIGGVGAGVWFYVWTNFGVWYLDEWNMYPDTLFGLFQSYIAGLPFLRYTVVGSIWFTAFAALCIESVTLLYNVFLTRKPRLAYP